MSGIASILNSKQWAQLGDSYLNFLYSCALTKMTSIPTGKRVNDRILVEVARKSGVRKLLPKRTSRGRVADAIEALLAFAWIRNIMSFEDMIVRITKNPDNLMRGLNIIVDEIFDKISRVGFPEENLAQTVNYEIMLKVDVGGVKVKQGIN